MKKLLTAALIISIIILLIDIVSVIIFNQTSDGLGFIKEIGYLVCISIAIASIISIVICIIKLNRM